MKGHPRCSVPVGSWLVEPKQHNNMQQQPTKAETFCFLGLKLVYACLLQWRDGKPTMHCSGLSSIPPADNSLKQENPQLLVIAKVCESHLSASGCITTNNFVLLCCEMRRSRHLYHRENLQHLMKCWVLHMGIIM